VVAHSCEGPRETVQTPRNVQGPEHTDVAQPLRASPPCIGTSSRSAAGRRAFRLPSGTRRGKRVLVAERGVLGGRPVPVIP